MEKGQTLRPLFRRLIVLSAPFRAKVSAGLLYQPNERRAAYSRVQEAWVVWASPRCKGDFARAQKVYVQDAFEIEQLPNQDKLWAELREDPSFKELREIEDLFEATVLVSIIAEDSILAIDDGLDATASLGKDSALLVKGPVVSLTDASTD